MTDIVTCPHCESDKGFRPVGGVLYCKRCGQEYRTVNQYKTVRDIAIATGMHPEVKAT